MQTENFVRFALGYDEFEESAKVAKDIKELKIHYNYTKLKIMKEWGYRLSKNTCYYEISLLEDFIINYCSLIESKINEIAAKPPKSNSSDKGFSTKGSNRLRKPITL